MYNTGTGPLADLSQSDAIVCQTEDEVDAALDADDARALEDAAALIGALVQKPKYSPAYYAPLLKRPVILASRGYRGDTTCLTAAERLAKFWRRVELNGGTREG